jgi:hypothetical protein
MRVGACQDKLARMRDGRRKMCIWQSCQRCISGKRFAVQRSVLLWHCVCAVHQSKISALLFPRDHFRLWRIWSHKAVVVELILGIRLINNNNLFRALLNLHFVVLASPFEKGAEAQRLDFQSCYKPRYRLQQLLVVSMDMPDMGDDRKLDSTGKCNVFSIPDPVSSLSPVRLHQDQREIIPI